MRLARHLSVTAFLDESSFHENKYAKLHIPDLFSPFFKFSFQCENKYGKQHIPDLFSLFKLNIFIIGKGKEMETEIKIRVDQSLEGMRHAHKWFCPVERFPRTKAL